MPKIVPNLKITHNQLHTCFNIYQNVKILDSKVCNINTAIQDTQVWQQGSIYSELYVNLCNKD